MHPCSPTGHYTLFGFRWYPHWEGEKELAMLGLDDNQTQTLAIQ
jgi:hypothetical protein